MIIFAGFSLSLFLLDLIALALFITIAEYEFFPITLFSVLIIFPAVLWYLNPLAFSAIMSNPISLVITAIVYVSIGIVYSFYKWYAHCISMKDKIKEDFEEFKKLKILKDFTEAEILKEFKDSSRNPIRRVGFSLSDSNNWKIANWIVNWPVLLIWNVIRGFTIDLTRNIIKFFGTQYDAISNKIFKDIS